MQSFTKQIMQILLVQVTRILARVFNVSFNMKMYKNKTMLAMSYINYNIDIIKIIPKILLMLILLHVKISDLDVLCASLSIFIPNSIS